MKKISDGERGVGETGTSRPRPTTPTRKGQWVSSPRAISTSWWKVRTPVAAAEAETVAQATRRRAIQEAARGRRPGAARRSDPLGYGSGGRGGGEVGAGGAGGRGGEGGAGDGARGQARPPPWRRPRPRRARRRARCCRGPRAARDGSARRTRQRRGSGGGCPRCGPARGRREAGASRDRGCGASRWSRRCGADGPAARTRPGGVIRSRTGRPRRVGGPPGCGRCGRRATGAGRSVRGSRRRRSGGRWPPRPAAGRSSSTGCAGDEAQEIAQARQTRQLEQAGEEQRAERGHGGAGQHEDREGQCPQGGDRREAVETAAGQPRQRERRRKTGRAAE